MRNDFVKQSDEKPFFAKSKKKVRKELENIRFTKIYTCKTIDGLCNCSGFIACVNYFKVPIKIGSREAFPCVYSVDVFYIIVESLVFKTMNSLCHLIDLRYTKLGALKHVRDIKSFQRQRRVIAGQGETTITWPMTPISSDVNGHLILTKRLNLALIHRCLYTLIFKQFKSSGY